jgi:hypothetical protein
VTDRHHTADRERGFAEGLLLLTFTFFNLHRLHAFLGGSGNISIRLTEAPPLLMFVSLRKRKPQAGETQQDIFARAGGVLFAPHASLGKFRGYFTGFAATPPPLFTHPEGEALKS